MTSIFFLILLSCIVSHYRVTCQCSGTPKIVHVGYSTVMISPPENVSTTENSTLGCDWIVSSTTDASLLFQVTDLMINCSDGVMDIYEGTNSSGKSLFQDVCRNGTDTLDYKSAISGDVFISYTSNAVTDMDFKIYVISAMGFRTGTGECNDTKSLTATNSTQYILVFPDKFNKTADCSWQISTNEQTSIKVNIEFLLLGSEQTTENGTYDYLEIKESEQTIVKLVKNDVYNAWLPNRTYMSQGNNLTVVFHLADSTMKGGFLLSYNQAENQMSTETEAQSTIPISHQETSTKIEPGFETTTMKEVQSTKVEQRTVSTTPKPSSTTTKPSTTTTKPDMSPMPPPLSDGDDDDDDNAGVIVGVVIGGLVAVVIVTIIIIMYKRKASAFAIFNVTTYSKQKDEVTVEDNNSKTGDENPAFTDDEDQTQQEDKEVDKNDGSAIPDANVVLVDETTTKSDNGELSKANVDNNTNINGSPESQTIKSETIEGDLIKLDDSKVIKEDPQSLSSDTSVNKQDPLPKSENTDSKPDGLLAAIDGEISSKEDNLISLDDTDTNEANESTLSGNDNVVTEENSKSIPHVIDGDTNKEETTEKPNSINDNTSDVTTREMSELTKEDKKTEKTVNDKMGDAVGKEEVQTTQASDNNSTEDKTTTNDENTTNHEDATS